MKTFEFKLIINTNTKAEPESHLDALYEAGCDDALVSFSKRGTMTLDFMRESESASEAFNTAMENIKVAIPEATLIEASPDMVTTTDISQLLNHSRQNTRNLMLKQDSPFPVHSGNPSIWHLEDVLVWLAKKNKTTHYNIDLSTIEVANTARNLNLKVANSQNIHAELLESY